MRASIRMKATLILSAAMLGACASTAHVVPQPAVDIAPDDRFVPVNFSLDAGEYVMENEAQVAQYISDSVRGSGRFVRVERMRPVWPHTLVMTYRWKGTHTAAQTAGAIASVATLMLLPAPLREEHTLTIEVLDGPMPIKQFVYTEQVKTSLSLFNDPVEDRKAGIDRILARFYAELATSKIIPQAKDVLPKNAVKEQTSF
ncbi:MAG: hypothetical protein K0Q76_1469 [Panacagrimonas sp.]|nr:hypothetical protein [Panacagrimonas sp.]MCC2656361.1 hypothetical protein [Panacagrimonas sp.]